jgi:DNA repair exonuclease SbcCD ATPase subunit
MEHSNPFIKVEWEDTPENLTQERIKRVKTYFEKKYNSTNVKLVTKILSNNSNTKLQSLDASDNILDPQYQKNLIKDFIKENKIDVKWEMIDRLDNRVNGEIDKSNQNKVRYNKWFIKRVEFSNFLSFGDDNVINFTDLDGITVIESTPKNFGGKSTSTVDLLMFLFFNSTTKTKTNAEVFNKFRDTDYVKVKGYVTIDGEDYVIERNVSRKKSKAGEYTVKNELEFYKISEDGTVNNLSGEQRRETETFITTAIGTEEDFLSTILTTGNNLEELIDSKPTARGQILTKFLGLESLKQKEEVAKEIYSDWSKKLISNTNNIVQLELNNTEHQESISNSESEIVRLETALSDFEKELKRLEDRRDEVLGSRNNDIDKDLINTNPVLLEREIADLERVKQTSKTNADAVSVIEPSEYYLEDEHEKLSQIINGHLIEGKVDYDAIGRNEELIRKFEKGEICPTCNRALEDVDHTDEINKIKELIEVLKKSQQERQIKLDELTEQEKGYKTLKVQYEEYERNKLRKGRYELEVEQKQVEIDAKKLRLERYDDNKKKLEDNQKIDAEVMALRTKIETANGDIRQSTTNIERHRGNIVTMNDKIKVNLDLISKIKSEEELVGVFKTYLTIYGKNGISKVIMKNMIPLINQELHRLLSDSCYFTLELNINEKNELEFLMIDNETRVVKTLISGSGYEKTISSLALRSVLTKISSLPKPNIVVMDEVFGKVADDNLEMVGEFFKKIKNYFEHIFVISHNPLIRNWSDNIIMVGKTENVSSIEYINTKIS